MYDNLNWLRTKPIAHRGLHGKDISENSIPAFEEAIKHGYAIEIDVRLSSDGKVIVFHDNQLWRLTQSRGHVREKNYRDIKKLFLSETNDKIPLLSEALDCIRGRTPLLIEIKNKWNPGKLELAVAKILESYNGEFAIASFNPLSLKWFKKNQPSFTRGQTLDKCWQRTLIRILGLFKNDPQFVAYHYSRSLPLKIIRECHKRNIFLIAWTVRTQEEMDNALRISDNVMFEGFEPSLSLI